MDHQKETHDSDSRFYTRIVVCGAQKHCNSTYCTSTNANIYQHGRQLHKVDCEMNSVYNYAFLYEQGIKSRINNGICFLLAQVGCFLPAVIHTRSSD